MVNTLHKCIIIIIIIIMMYCTYTSESANLKVENLFTMCSNNTCSTNCK